MSINKLLLCRIILESAAQAKFDLIMAYWHDIADTFYRKEISLYLCYFASHRSTSFKCFECKSTLKRSVSELIFAENWEVHFFFIESNQIMHWESRYKAWHYRIKRNNFVIIGIALHQLAFFVFVWICCNT